MPLGRARLAAAVAGVVVVLVASSALTARASSNATASDGDAAAAYAIYEERALAPGWRDESWHTRMVDLFSNPGSNGSESAIDAWIEPWGAFALARVEVMDADADDYDDPPRRMVSSSDPNAATLALSIQGPLGSQRRPGPRERPSDWLPLSDGRAVARAAFPPRTPPSTEADADGPVLRTAPPPFQRPLSLGGINLYLEHSPSGRTTRRASLLSLARGGSDDVAQQQELLADVDGTAWTSLTIALGPLLEEAGMEGWDRLVIKVRPHTHPHAHRPTRRPPDTHTHANPSLSSPLPLPFLPLSLSLSLSLSLPLFLSLSLF